MRTTIAAVLLALALPAKSTTFTTDASDLWYNPNESGWGVNVIHQRDILFLTFFVYAQNGSPVWYSVSDAQYQGSTATGAALFSGGLYQTSGPWLGAATFNPTTVGYRQVGNASFSLDTITTATLSYTVDGVVVQKSLRRATWRGNDISGSYIGAIVGTYSNCNPASANGYLEEPGTITIVHSGTSASMQVITQTATCSYTGPYSQDGRMGSWSGSYSCTNGASGTFSAFEIEANPAVVSARATARNQFCSWSGRFGGLRRGQ